MSDPFGAMCEPLAMTDVPEEVRPVTTQRIFMRCILPRPLLFDNANACTVLGLVDKIRTAAEFIDQAAIRRGRVRF
jgi:hypothetical protein